MYILNNSTLEVNNPNKPVTLLYLQKFLKIWESRLNQYDSHGKIVCHYMGRFQSQEGANYHVLKLSIETYNQNVGPMFGYLDEDYQTDFREGKYYFEYLTAISKTRETKKTVIYVSDQKSA